MSSLIQCICCPFVYCCQLFGQKKVKKTPRRQLIREMKVRPTEQTSKDWENRLELKHPDHIKDKYLTKEYRIPDDFPSEKDCFKDQGLELKEEIDSGGFAKVYKVVDLKERTVFAAKLIKLGEGFRNPQNFESLKAELFIMIRAQKHRNIVSVVKHFIVTDFKARTDFCYIVMEFANGGNILIKMMANQKPPQKPKRLPEKTVKAYMRDISEGLKFLHSVKVAHKDLKLNNLLVFVGTDGTETIKITDFGLSRIRYDEQRKRVIKEVMGLGTTHYMSPQVLRLYIYNLFAVKVDKLHTYDAFRADCWSLGVCLYIMICAEFPFKIGNESQTEFINAYKLMKQRKYEISVNTKSTYSGSCLNLISELLEPTPDKRLTADIVLCHKWFTENN